MGRVSRKNKKMIIKTRIRRYDLTKPRKCLYGNETIVGWWNWASFGNVYIECNRVKTLDNGDIIVKHKPFSFNIGWGPTFDRCYSLISKKNKLYVANCNVSPENISTNMFLACGDIKVELSIK